MNKPQTAVEWLAIQLYEQMNMSGDGEVYDQILEQAKQMEKQQIIKSWVDGKENESFGYSAESDAINYYNENYNHE